VIFRFLLFSAFICIFSCAVFGQIDSLIGQVTDSATESFAGGMSADGRFIVFESRGDLATENPRNADGNREIFLFDYAQRRIFQITDTKSVLYDPSITGYVFSNVRVEITNVRPVISADGRWIAFSSNATSATPAVPNTTNPGSFDGNTFTAATPTPTPSVSPTPNPTATPTPSPSPSATPTPAANPLTSDGNLEMWLYQVPAFAPVADLSAGDDLPLTNLAGGTFTMVTNTDASQTPRAATPTIGAFVASDNHDASISDDGSVIAFVSTRDLVPCQGNAFPADDNDEIYTYSRTATPGCVINGNPTSIGLRQVTKTPRGPIGNPIYNKAPTISGNGGRVSFASTGDNPIIGMTGGINPSTSRNEEIFFSDLVGGSPSGTMKQVTVTTPTNPGDIVNILDIGRRMSKDGTFIAFDSYADLKNENGGANYTSFALYVYNTTANSFTRVAPRSMADPAVATGGGDVDRYPAFTDYDSNGTPRTLVLETRLNIKPDGTIPISEAEGLNPIENRPPQLYSYPLNVAQTSATFTRLALFPTPTSFLSTTQAITSDSLERTAFNLGAIELGTGNFDGLSEVFYLLNRPHPLTMKFGPQFYTGATRQSINTVPGTAPSPTPTVTPTPTPSPSPSVSPTPTPTPETPPSVFGMSPGMLARMEFGRPRSITPRTASTIPARAPGLPWELSGVTFGINGLACGLKSVDANHLEFVTPRAIASGVTGTAYKAVLNVSGTVSAQRIAIVPVRPDIFNSTMTPAPGGRTKMFNVTNRIYTTEPFVVRTIRRHGNLLTPSVLRIYLTGVANVDPTLVTIRIRDGDKIMTGIAGTNVLVEPGVYTVDFPLSVALDGAGPNLPVVVTVTAGGVTFSSRLDDTTSKISIL
jgi:hypothetical protein